ncbi:MAG TPA: histidine kinase [Pilimelia sp.]|nr:histidine kinase [Pilimelia sp.]
MERRARTPRGPAPDRDATPGGPAVARGRMTGGRLGRVGPARAVATDVALAGLVFLGTLGILATQGFGSPDPRARSLDTLGTLLAAAATLPLALRRLAPALGYGTVATATVVLLALRYPLDVPVGAALGGYALAVARSGDPRPLRRRAAMLAVTAFVPLLAVAYGVAGVDVWGITPELVAWALVFVGVWVAGDRTRLRRERLAELEERARRTEREAERERRLAAAEERTRIARELHDSAGHAINVILVQAGAARLLHERDPQRSRRAIATIEEVARDTLGEIDRLVRALRADDGGEPPPADPAALDELLATHRANGLRIVADLPGGRRQLPRAVAWAAYRILQEALTNAARHGIGSAEVSVRHTADAVELTVRNPAAAVSASGAGRGHGVVGMRERASLLGGVLTTEVRHGVFLLSARLPYRPESGTAGPRRPAPDAAAAGGGAAGGGAPGPVSAPPDGSPARALDRQGSP